MAHLESLGLDLAGKSVLDVGCGIGHLAQFFVKRQCHVTCVDGREENIAALRSRYPGLAAHVANVETDSLARFGQFDIVFCYGLLYHLENPVAGLRNMAQICRELLILETVITDHSEPLVRLLDEPRETANQALAGMGCRPTPAFVAMALNRAGFPYIYAPKTPPNHPDFQFAFEQNLDCARSGHLLRAIFVASRDRQPSEALTPLLQREGIQDSAGFLPVPMRPAPTRVWLDVGAHLGEKTLPAAQANPDLRVYAFEPNLQVAVQRMGLLPNFVMLPMAVSERDGSTEFHVNAFDAASSLLPMNVEGRANWIGGEELAEVRREVVPTIRLETFLDSFGIQEVEFLKVDAQGADLEVVRSAGKRLKDIQRIALEVQIVPTALYRGAASKEAVIRFMERSGFVLVHAEKQSHGQEENLTFERAESVKTEASTANNEAAALEEAARLAFTRPLSPYPGWSFGAGWNNPEPAFRRRRELWEFFNQRRLETPLVFDWYDGLKFNLYLGNDLSRQLFIAGCAEPNEFAFLDRVLEPGMVFVDAGANEGLYTLFASRRVGASGHVLSFEPSEREYARLQSNLSLNQLTNVRAYQIALADRNGEEELAVAGFEHEGQNTLGAFVHQGVSLLRKEHVTMRQLDTLTGEEKFPKIDVIKLDVEGAEVRVIQGAQKVLREHRPVVLFEALESALQAQGSNLASLMELLSSCGYQLFAFDSGTGRPVLASPADRSDNMIAVPAKSDLAAEMVKESHAISSSRPNRQTTVTKEESFVPKFSPARAYWNQRETLAQARDRILALGAAVDQRSDLLPYQWAQLMAAAMDFAPDLILELGRGRGNSTCAFTEASNLNNGRSAVLSLCLSDSWDKETLPRVRKIVPENWFRPLDIRRADILDFDYRKALSGAKRVLIFWDAHGFDIAECVLGEIMPIVAPLEHLVIMHDLSDTRYSSDEQFGYGGHGLWKGNDWSGPRLKLGIIDSAVEQSIAALDFTTRNHLTFDSADHSFHTMLSGPEQSEMRKTLGELFDTQGHWFYFSLNEKPGPYKFPGYVKRSGPAKSRK